MKELLNASFLISGTAIGAGLLAQPLTLLTAYLSSMIDTLSLFFAIDYRSLASL